MGCSRPQGALSRPTTHEPTDSVCENIFTTVQSGYFRLGFGGGNKTDFGIRPVHPIPPSFSWARLKILTKNNVVREIARRRSLLSRHACIVHKMPSVRPRPRRPVEFSACCRLRDYSFTTPLFQNKNTLHNQRGQIQMHVERRARSLYVNITDSYMSRWISFVASSLAVWAASLLLFCMPYVLRLNEGPRKNGC